MVLLEKTADYLKQKNLPAAREAIELAAKNETTKNEARTWYLRGFVYKELYKENPAEPAHRETAVEALRKSVSLDSRKEFVNSSNAALDYLYGTYYNEGLDLINAKDYEKALNGLQRFIDYRAKAKPDAYYAEALYYAGVANNATGKKTEAQQCFEQALAKGYNNPILYDDLAQVYLANNNKAKALSTIEAGRKAFPTDAALRTAEINLALQMKEYVRAEKLIEEHLTTNPNDTDALMVAGTVYEAVGKRDTAKQEAYFEKRKAAYKKILTKDPNNFLANYNLGVAYYNQAVPLLNDQALELSITEFNTRLEYISKLIAEAKPYIEKASQLSPQNVNSLKALSGIYFFLNDREKFQQTQNKIKLLEKK